MLVVRLVNGGAVAVDFNVETLQCLPSPGGAHERVHPTSCARVPRILIMALAMALNFMRVYMWLQGPSMRTFSC